MLKTYDFHSFIQRPYFSQIAKDLFRASFFTPADIAPYTWTKPVLANSGSDWTSASELEEPMRSGDLRHEGEI